MVQDVLLITFLLADARVAAGTGWRRPLVWSGRHGALGALPSVWQLDAHLAQLG